MVRWEGEVTRWKGVVGVRCRGGLITDAHIYHVCKWHKDTEYLCM